MKKSKTVCRRQSKGSIIRDNGSILCTAHVIVIEHGGIVPLAIDRGVVTSSDPLGSDVARIYTNMQHEEGGVLKI